MSESISPFKDSTWDNTNSTTAAASTQSGVDVSYSYDASRSGNGDAADTTRLIERPRVVTTTTAGIVTGIAYFRYVGPSVTSGYAPSNAASSNPWSSAVLKSTTTLTGANSFTSTFGALTTTQTASGTSLQSTSSWGATILANAQTTLNAFGGLVSSSSSGLGQSTVSSAGGTPDAFGRVGSATLSNGLTSSASGFGWFGPASSTGTDNLASALHYTALGQLLDSTSAGVKSSFAYDAAGNLLSETEDGTANATTSNPDVTVTNSATYDAHGRYRSAGDFSRHSRRHADGGYIRQ